MPFDSIESLLLPKTRVTSPVVGWICGYEPERGILVDFPGNVTPGQPIPARAAVELSPQLFAQSSAQREQVVLVFEDEDSRLPIILGLVRSTAGALPSPKPAAAAPAVDAFLDGKRVVLRGQEEIVLRCGKASLTLRRDGTVLLKGVQVVSQATDTNRIRGGSVQIN